MNELVFDKCLAESGEIGFIDRVYTSLVYVTGLPSAHPSELVVFETGGIGQILSLSQDSVEVLLFSLVDMHVGTKVTRSNKYLQLPVGQELLGSVIDPMGNPYGNFTKAKTMQQARYIDVLPVGFSTRTVVREPLETGISIVDLMVPLGRGQRELVLGDRKTGKTSFLLQVLLNQALKDTICIYTAVGKRQVDIKHIYDFVKEKSIEEKVIIVASGASEASGKVFITPYSAMTIAEYFRDTGKDVLLILDDLTSHAQYYREIALMGRRFPGRNSYPGDVFYIHSRLLERAGSFEKGSITCLVIADTVLGDLSGYIQTNLMAITDGHIFFDTEIFNQGRRPAVNTYLSVTRVGEQAQSALVKDLGRELSRFLVQYQKLRDLSHFGTDFEQRVKDQLALGNRIFVFFDQQGKYLMPINVSALVIALLWAGYWKRSTELNMKAQIDAILRKYNKDQKFNILVDTLISSTNTFASLIKRVSEDPDFVIFNI